MCELQLRLLGLLRQAGLSCPEGLRSQHLGAFPSEVNRRPYQMKNQAQWLYPCLCTVSLSQHTAYMHLPRRRLRKSFGGICESPSQ